MYNTNCLQTRYCNGAVYIPWPKWREVNIKLARAHLASLMSLVNTL